MTKVIVKEPHSEPLVYVDEVDAEYVMNAVGCEDANNLYAASLGAPSEDLTVYGYVAMAFFDGHGGDHPCENIRVPEAVFDGHMMGEHTVVDGPICIVLVPHDLVLESGLEPALDEAIDFSRKDIDVLFAMIELLRVDEEEELRQGAH